MRISDTRISSQLDVTPVVYKDLLQVSEPTHENELQPAGLFPVRSVTSALKRLEQQQDLLF